jgi:hypothetical protein
MSSSTKSYMLCVISVIGSDCSVLVNGNVPLLKTGPGCAAMRQYADNTTMLRES